MAQLCSVVYFQYSLSFHTGREWDVEDIIDVRRQGKGFSFAIKWDGFDQITWEPYRNIKSILNKDNYTVTKTEKYRRFFNV